MNRKKIFLMVFLGVVLFMLGCKDYSDAEASGILENGVRVIEATAFKFDFDPDPIIVNQGESVKLIMTSIDIPHGIAIPEYDINEKLLPGEPVTMEFTANKAGKFVFYCSVPCGSGHGTMRGKIIVKESP